MFGLNMPIKAMAFTLFILSLAFVGCSTSNGVADNLQNSGQAAVKVKVGLGEVGRLAKPVVAENGVLSKAAAISLKNLIFVLTSNTGDTLRDTITTTSSPVSISAVSTSPQTIAADFPALKALRSWKVVATTRDVNDSIIQQDSAVSPVLYAGDTAAVSLSLTSKYTMYDAKFLSLPDSISSPVSGTVRQVLILNRLVLKVDGIVRVDSVAAGGFTPNATATLSYDYITSGSHDITLEAWGRIKASASDALLFTGAQTINVAAGSDSAVALNLGWVGPTTGTGQISATIDKVGKVTVNGSLPGSEVP